MEISIERIAIVNKGALKAFLDIVIELGEIGSIELRNCRLIQQVAQQAWLSGPQSQYFAPNGEMKYSTVVKLNGAIKEEIQQIAIDKYVAIVKGDGNLNDDQNE